MWNLVGHDNVFAALQADIAAGNLAHANLFTGPGHVGKYSAAKWLARSLQCKDGGCGECHVCSEIEKGLHADTIELVDDGEGIRIEQIRKLIDRVNMTRREKYKILLIENIERMRGEAANALLKTLEDPPEGVLFLLTTSRAKEVLATIISRVRVYKFANLDASMVRELLRSHFPLVEEDDMAMAAELSGGKPGKALQLMEDSDLRNAHRRMYADIEELMAESDKVRQSAFAADLVALAKDEKGKRVIDDFLDICQLVLRKKMVMNVEGEDGILSQEKVLEMLEKIDDIREQSKRNVNMRMMLENLMFML